MKLKSSNLTAYLSLFLFATGAAANERDDDAKRFAALEKSLTGASLVGHFTVTGESGAAPAAERYDLGKVKHLGDGRWLIEARIRYGEHDVPIPLTLPIRWAGDTPIITVDKLAIPGLGVYTARVMIYQDHYAGFWTAPDHGGHLYGVIERPDSPSEGNDEPGTNAEGGRRATKSE